MERPPRRGPRRAERGVGGEGVLSEGRLVGRPGGRRPRGATTAPAPGPPEAAAPTAAAEAAATLTARGAGDLGRGVPERGADLVDLQLDHGALLAFLGLERALLEPAGHEDPRAAGQRLGDVLRRLAPDVAAEEQRLAVLPLLRLAVEGARRGGHGEVGDGGA